jgi:outer membrane lipoprotein-sorting protein
MSGTAMTRLKFLVMSALLALGFATPIFAAKSMELSAEQAETVNRISEFMNSFSTLQGDFTQVSPQGNVSKGKMYISKPGKMRFDYAAPNPFLIVSDGKWVTLKNRAKEKGDQYPLSATPLRFVVSPGVNLLRETNVLGFEKADGIASVMLEDKKGAVSGKIILVFDEKENRLQQWVIIDGKGRRTTVTLSRLEMGVDMDPKLFVVKINRKPRDR